MVGLRVGLGDGTLTGSGQSRLWTIRVVILEKGTET